MYIRVLYMKPCSTGRKAGLFLLVEHDFGLFLFFSVYHYSFHCHYVNIHPFIRFSINYKLKKKIFALSEDFA